MDKNHGIKHKIWVQLGRVAFWSADIPRYTNYHEPYYSPRKLTFWTQKYGFGSDDFPEFQVNHVSFWGSWWFQIVFKESAKDAHAARTAGFLFAVTESGLLLDVMELIGAESLSQRYHFTAQCAHRLPSLRCIVHDDSCHLKAMCIRQRGDSPLAARLADFDFVIDGFHASGHTCQRDHLALLSTSRSLQIQCCEICFHKQQLTT